jgi:uncharacterized protein YkwD
MTTVEPRPPLQAKTPLSPRRKSSLWYHSIKMAEASGAGSDNTSVTTSPEDQDLAHELVNQERLDRGLKPLARSPKLDSLALLHARNMGAEGGVFHSVENLSDLRSALSSRDCGENVKRGPSVRKIHINTINSEDCPSRANMLSTTFTEMGCATAKDKEGHIYLVQLFRKGKRSSSRRDLVTSTITSV